MDDRTTNDGYRETETWQEEPSTVPPRATLHRLIDEMGDDAVQRLLAVVEAWRDRYPTLLPLWSCLLVLCAW